MPLIAALRPPKRRQHLVSVRIRDRDRDRDRDRVTVRVGPLILQATGQSPTLPSTGALAQLSQPKPGPNSSFL